MRGQLSGYVYRARKLPHIISTNHTSRGSVCKQTVPTDLLELFFLFLFNLVVVTLLLLGLVLKTLKGSLEGHGAVPTDLLEARVRSNARSTAPNHDDGPPRAGCDLTRACCCVMLWRVVVRCTLCGVPPRPPQLGSKDETAKAAEKARELLAREPDNRASSDTDMFSFGGEDDPSNRPPTKGVRTRNTKTSAQRHERGGSAAPPGWTSSARSNPTSHSGWVCFI